LPAGSFIRLIGSSDPRPLRRRIDATVSWSAKIGRTHLAILPRQLDFEPVQIGVRTTDILGSVIASLGAGAQLSDNGLKKVRQEDTR